MELVESYEDVEKNVRSFNEGLESSDDLQQKLSAFIVWYYIPSADAVGPSKYIGYRDMTAEKYHQLVGLHGELDGGQTESRLKQKEWFRELVKDTPEHERVKGKVEELVRKFDKSINKSARFLAPSNWNLNSIHMRRVPLNTILYGPPGTGKTYATARRCVEICDGSVEDSNEAVRRRYDALVKEERIEFVTFHQSYGYEEFVEGLRPDTGPGDPTEGKEERKEEIGGGFRLVATDGVLKRIAKRAREPGAEDAPVDLTGRQIFKMALRDPDRENEHADLFNMCISNGEIRLGRWDLGEDLNLSDRRFEDHDELLGRLQEVDSHATARSKIFQSLNYFRREMKLRDLVIVPDGRERFRAVGEITGKYEFAPENKYGYCHCRKVQWHWSSSDSIPISDFYDSALGIPAIHQLKLQKIRQSHLLRYIAPATGPERKPHVLIIDEINRANVSKVMGELVTLLEEDKRESAENEVAVTLPHSRHRFTLPPNLHILGTMNTADRSIALLDTALRRRFEFEELAPNPGVLRDAKEAAGINLPEVLRAMNERLEWLIDRDHMIGHAWLMGARTKEDVDRAMRHKIIPLIAEYFYDDWEKVRAVLGGGDEFVQRERLAPPPGLDAAGEVRYRWTVREEFADGAYERLISGGISALQAPAP